MKTLFYLLLFIFIFRENYGNRLINGFVLDSITKEGIAGAHVINYTTFKGTTTDTTGHFITSVLPGDSLLIQSIEYKRKFVTISDSLFKPFIILLSVQQYKIKEVKVGILGNYDQFKQMVLNYDPNKYKIRIPGMKEPVYRPVPILEDREYWDNPKRALVSPVSYLYYKYNKHAQSVFKNQEFKKQQQEQLRADDKYNRELIKRLTGLKEEEEITGFMLFCNFSHDFIMNSDEYEICRQIMIRFEAFKKERGKKGKDGREE